nr:unnamed protein product [Haemonchus contortus]
MLKRSEKEWKMEAEESKSGSKRDYASSFDTISRKPLAAKAITFVKTTGIPTATYWITVTTESAIIPPHRPKRKRRGSDDYTKIILLWIVAAILVVSVIVYVYYDHTKVKAARKRQRLLLEKKLEQKRDKDKQAKKKKRPRQMRAAKLNPKEFKSRGPLVLQAALRGEVKHGLDQDKSVSLKNLKFDPSQNEIVLIGTEIERLEGQSQSIEQADRSYEVMEAANMSPKAPVVGAKQAKKSPDRTQTPSSEGEHTPRLRASGFFNIERWNKVLVLLEYPATTTAGNTLRQLHNVKRQHVIKTENKTIPQPPPTFVSSFAPMTNKQHGDGAEQIKSTAILGDKISML